MAWHRRELLARPLALADAAYPEAAGLRRLKAEVDPQGRFSNEMWRRYLLA
ncbi:hypothetical protein [Roseateles sp. LKC17W]|uniref:D-arabinono-1,4-lactone oxidase C-terminal domain-containing protein n=1 Tax=Pelomonas margarita TaxID=3299031 RepID=A0ABW7FJ65_9BURK